VTCFVYNQQFGSCVFGYHWMISTTILCLQISTSAWAVMRRVARTETARTRLARTPASATAASRWSAPSAEVRHCCCRTSVRRTHQRTSLICRCSSRRNCWQLNVDGDNDPHIHGTRVQKVGNEAVLSSVTPPPPAPHSTTQPSVKPPTSLQLPKPPT